MEQMFIQGSTMGAMTSPTRMPAPPVMAAAAGRFRWNNSWRVAVGASNRLTREVRAAKITAAKKRIRISQPPGMVLSTLADR